MASVMCLKLSKNLFSFTKLCHSAHKKTLLANSAFPINRAIARRQIADSRKESINSANEDLSETLISFKYIRLIKKAIREFGPFVEENKKLALLLKKAKEHRIPDDFLDFAMKISVDDRAQVGLLEMLLLNSCHLIIQYEDIDLTATKPHMLKLCDEYDAHLQQEDSKWPLHFEQMGFLSLKTDAACPLFSQTKDLQEAALKVGAKTATNEVDPEGIPHWLLYCDPGDLHEVKRHLVNEGCEIEEAYVSYVPKKQNCVIKPY